MHRVLALHGIRDNCHSKMDWSVVDLCSAACHWTPFSPNLMHSPRPMALLWAFWGHWSFGALSEQSFLLSCLAPQLIRSANQVLPPCSKSGEAFEL